MDFRPLMISEGLWSRQLGLDCGTRLSLNGTGELAK